MSTNGDKSQPMHWKALFTFIACGGAMLSFFGYGVMSRMMDMQDETQRFERENRAQMTEAFALMADAAADAARAAEVTANSVNDLARNQRAMVDILREVRDDQRAGVWRDVPPMKHPDDAGGG